MNSQLVLMRMLLYPISGWPHHTLVASPLVADISKNKQETEEMRFLTYGQDCFNAGKSAGSDQPDGSPSWGHCPACGGFLSRR